MDSARAPQLGSEFCPLRRQGRGETVSGILLQNDRIGQEDRAFRISDGPFATTYWRLEYCLSPALIRFIVLLSINTSSVSSTLAKSD
jgi:hypothetical protein